MPNPNQSRNTDTLLIRLWTLAFSEMPNRYFLILIALLCISSLAIAREECFQQSAKEFTQDVNLLKAISKAESNFNEQAISTPNDDGSVDIGLMQINSGWIPKLKKHGITREMLFDPCVNIKVGAWILAKNVEAYGNVWRAVGAYNAKTPWKQQRYIERVRAAYNELQKHDFNITEARLDRPTRPYQKIVMSRNHRLNRDFIQIGGEQEE